MGKNSTVVKLTNGMGVRISSGFASSVFKALQAEVPPSMMGPAMAFSGLTKFSSRQEISYKKEGDLGDSFDGIPTLADAIEKVEQMSTQIPPELTPHLKGLSKVAAGIKSMKLEGLPMDWEVAFNFKDFNPFPLLG